VIGLSRAGFVVVPAILTEVPSVETDDMEIKGVVDTRRLLSKNHLVT